VNLLARDGPLDGRGVLRLSRSQHTELVVVGVGHDHPGDVALPDVDTRRSECGDAVDFILVIDFVGRGDVEMQAVLAELPHQRRSTPLDDRTGAVSGTDRSLLVLIPNQWPAEYFAPELADLARSIGVDRSETPAAGEEVAVWLDDAELVALRVDQNDMTFVSALTDVDVTSTQCDQSLDQVVLVLERGGREVEMDVVLPHLRLWCRPEENAELGVVGRNERGVTVGLVELPAQRRSPEARQKLRIVGIDAQIDDAGSRLGLDHHGFPS